MAFLLDRRNDFSWPISVGVPDGGEIRQEKFTARLKNLDEDAFRSSLEAIQDGSVTEVEMAEKLLVGFTEVTDAAHQPVVFTAASKQQLLACPGVANAIVSSWMDARIQATEKNSGMSRTTGPGPTV